MSLNTESHYLFTHQVGSTQWHSAENQKAQGQGHEPVILFIPINAFLLFVCLFVFPLHQISLIEEGILHTNIIKALHITFTGN